MASEFKLPDLGENVESGEVIKVLVAVGDALTEDQPVLELETDKAVIEVPSSVSGTVSQIFVSEGDTATVSQVILTVEEEDGSPPATAASVSAEQTPEQVTAPKPGPELPDNLPVEVSLPELGEDIESGDVVGIMISVGADIAVDDPVLEIEIDKGVVEMPSPVAGKVTALHVSKGDRVTVDQLVLTVEVTVGAPAVTPTPQVSTPVTGQSSSSTTLSPPHRTPVATPAVVSTDTPPPTKLVPAAPSVRRLAREIGIDIAHVKGSGPAGRISADDVKSYSRALNSSRAIAETGGKTAAEQLPDFSKWGEVERKPMSNIRRVTAQHMARAWSTIPHVTQFDKADITDLEVWRKEYGKVAEAVGGKLTPTAIVLKVAAAALSKFTAFNTSIDIANEEVVFKKYINIGVAVDTQRGLLVPVVRNVDKKNIVQLSVELTEIAEKARSGKLGLEDMQGGTFTISNLGGIGGTAFTPIVNAPEVAILGVARGTQEPVWSKGSFVPRLMMPLSLSYDHRLIDGADGARFLRWLCEALENPFLMALEG